MNWFSKYLIDVKYSNDADLIELKALIAKAESDESMEYNQWLSTLAGLHMRLNNRYEELNCEYARGFI